MEELKYYTEQLEKLKTQIDELSDKNFQLQKEIRYSYIHEYHELVDDIQSGLNLKIKELNKLQEDYETHVDIESIKTFIGSIQAYIDEFKKSYRIK